MPDRPNILLILTDHFRRDAVGPWTPNLLQLASRGTRFTHAYCGSPLCMPSRTSIVTGLLPWQNGVCGNMAEPLRELLRRDTYVHHLHDAGYRTSLVGKHHWIDSYGLNRDVTQDDEAIRGFGFDDVFQVLDEMEGVHNDDEFTHHLRREGRLDRYREQARRHANEPGPFNMAEEDYVDRFICDHACRWLDEHGKNEGGQPWYLNVSFVGPHPPMWHPGECEIDPENVPLEVVGTQRTAAIDRNRSHYLQKCILIDRYIGRLMETLAEKGQLDHTLIVFTSDHGDMLGDFGIWDKRYFYEQSVGVPLILAGPGVPRSDRGLGGQIRRDLVSLLDLYPTFLHVAGAAPAPGSGFRGRRFGIDLLAMLEPDSRVGHEMICAALGTHVMGVNSQWKIVFDPEQGGVTQLFNHRNDPRELHNLAGMPNYESVAGEMVANLLALRIGLSQYTHEKERTRLQRVRQPIRRF